MTLTRFLTLEQRHAGGAGNLTHLLLGIQTMVKVVNNCVRSPGMGGLFGSAGSSNVTGDNQQKLDVMSNTVLINALRDTGEVALMVSEENDEPILVPEHPDAKYVIAFDPLDGSSNIDANVSIGTIFTIYHRTRGAGETPDVSEILQPGSNIVAAGYAMYGSATVLVLSTGHGVNSFTLDDQIGEFILTHQNIKIKEDCNIYSINEGNSQYWDKPTTDFVASCKAGSKPWSARYIGSMVSDIHRSLIKGGIFMYPGDSKAKKGKLRLLYEVAPMSFIMEQAGGKSTTGTQRVLDIQPTEIHQRSPVFLGSANAVAAVEKLYASQLASGAPSKPS